MIDDSVALLVCCPNCKEGSLTASPDGKVYACARCHACFPVARGRPVLIRHDNPVFTPDSYVNAAATRERRGVLALLGRLIPSPSVNLAIRDILNELRTALDSKGRCAVLVVGAGSQRSTLDRIIRAACAHHIVYSDVDVAADVDLYCDVHDLPFRNDVFDAVITTAVLEHVLRPEAAAREITRVVKEQGFLYSEMPFMQQVHEGAYDFSRYTLSGHRRLFNRFSEVRSGIVAGPATALVWAIENLALAFLSGKTVRQFGKAAIRLGFGWLKYVDYLLAGRPEAMDGASCTYFLGRKSAVATTDAEIIRRYVGAKHVKHT